MSRLTGFSEKRIVGLGLRRGSVPTSGQDSPGWIEYYFWLLGKRKPVRVTLNPDLAVPDPLGEFYTRVSGRLKEQATAALQYVGVSVSGHAWTLDNNYLTLERQLLAFDEIAAAEIVDERVCIWR